jgi:D-arabinose 1-dehydrogenase-like Zn-dependent alcohol dehydrogenase
MYKLINLKSGAVETVSLEEAARRMQLSGEEIEWAVECCGVCSTDEYEIEAIDK